MTKDALPELLEALRTIEQDLWTPDKPPTLETRNTAARAALEGGWTAEDLATELKVEPEDIRRWASTDS